MTNNIYFEAKYKNIVPLVRRSAYEIIAEQKTLHRNKLNHFLIVCDDEKVKYGDSSLICVIGQRINIEDIGPLKNVKYDSETNPADIQAKILNQGRDKHNIILAGDEIRIYSQEVLVFDQNLKPDDISKGVMSELKIDRRDFLDNPSYIFGETQNSLTGHYKSDLNRQRHDQKRMYKKLFRKNFKALKDVTDAIPMSSEFHYN